MCSSSGTSRRLTGRRSRPWTLSVQAVRAKIYLSRARGRDWTVQEAAYSAEQLTLFVPCDVPRVGGILDSSSGKTCREHSAATRALTFAPCLRRSGRPRFQYLQMANGQTPEWQTCLNVKLHGASSTLNIGECPNVVAESSLSQILEPRQDVRAKYYLSPKACEGILRRARERGKELSPELKEALERQLSAAWWRRALLERLRRLLEASGTSRNYRQR